MKSQRILFVISLVDRSLAFEWFFRELQNSGASFQVAFLNPYEPALAKYCKSLNITTHWIQYQNKSDTVLAFFKLWWLMIWYRINLLHAHLFDASFVALMAARFAGVGKRIHTRHHASQHHQYNPHAVKYDRFINNQSKHIIAISDGIKKILVEKENVHADKITIVHHGFDLNYFNQVNAERIDSLRKKYSLQQAQPVIGVVSRWTHWKGIQFVIPAFKTLLQQYPSAVLLLANATGEYEMKIEEMLKEIPVNCYRKISFEPDTPALYQLMNVFVHVPIDNHSEAFGQVYVEALAAGIPSVFTLSGVANEFIVDKKNAIVVSYQNAEAIANAVHEILNSNSLCDNLIANGKTDVAKHFDIQLMVAKTKMIYER